jgi:hypothetical protein
MDGGQLKNVCLLSVCDEFVTNYLLNRWSNWAKNFFLQKLEKMCIWEFNPEVQASTP